MNVIERAGKQAGNAKRESIPWIERLARLGYAAKGIVYIIVGVLAVQAARGSGSARVDQNSAFLTILQQPFGKFLLVIVAVGLVGYALWRLIQAAVDPEREGKQKEGVIKRIGYAVSGISYAALSAAAFRLALGGGGGNGGGSGQAARDWTARLLGQPMGRWLVILAGLVVLVVGLVQISQAVTKKFEQRFQSGKLDGEQKRWAIRIGRIGYAAKGLVIGLVGAFLVQAAWQYDAQKAGGLGDALARLASQPYGAYLLIVVAAGLLAYGAYALFLSQYRRIPLY